MESTLRALFDHWLVTIVLIYFTAWLLGTIVEEIRKYGCYRQDVILKRELVDRGLNVDEIERIVAAKPTTDKKSADG